MEVFFFLCIALIFIGVMSSTGKARSSNVKESRNTTYSGFRNDFISLPDEVKMGFMNNLEEQQRLQFEQLLHNESYECSEEMIDKFNKWCENKEDKFCDTSYSDNIEDNNDYIDTEEDYSSWETEDTYNSDDSSPTVE